MRRVSVRVDDTLYQRLQRRALGTNLSLSDFVRSVLVQAADTRGRYIYSSQDELLGIVIQILTLVATSIGVLPPAIGFVPLPCPGAHARRRHPNHHQE
jgi:hypothetical protein